MAASCCAAIIRASRNSLVRIPCLVQRNIGAIHTNSALLSIKNSELDQFQLGVRVRSKQWDRYNEIVYPPLEEGQTPRPAEITHVRFNVKYSPEKLWYIACMVRGMSIDEAIKQVSFYKRQGCVHIKEVLLEAQEMAVRDHNVEFKSNLWIADSFTEKGEVVKGLRKHRSLRYGIVHYRYSHYFVRLREGKPPKHYYPPPLTGHEKMEEYIRDMRARRIAFGL
ncbi:39S ribosomal protein L22, mitochondrial [Patella vulgata]|uniref:39S ribosomal protein L22, mitochondrial n=1 Tax=Patella vulgata TaxID=6465 RepID=UPI0024A983CC|nr:39S ribosomal protein L22, mitochondrial [Patella vulgata]